MSFPLVSKDSLKCKQNFINIEICLSIISINKMSNRKRNVEFLKPEEPDFIKKLKASVGLTDGPNIETKVFIFFFLILLLFLF
jgi:hypothetical protein